MTDQKHTPGDWAVDRSDRRGTHLYVTANMGTADVCRVTDNGSAAANARLIAAAPGMAAALGNLLDLVINGEQGQSHRPVAIEHAQAALKRAGLA